MTLARVLLCRTHGGNAYGSGLRKMSDDCRSCTQRALLDRTNTAYSRTGQYAARRAACSLFALRKCLERLCPLDGRVGSHHVQCATVASASPANALLRSLTAGH